MLDKQALSRSFTLKIRSNVEVNPTNVYPASSCFNLLQVVLTYAL